MIALKAAYVDIVLVSSEVVFLVNNLLVYFALHIIAAYFGLANSDHNS